MVLVSKWINFIVMVIAIPLDYAGWNIIFAWYYGYRSPRACAKDGYKLWKGDLRCKCLLSKRLGDALIA